MSRRARRAAARRERRGIGAWRAAVNREADASMAAWLATEHRRRRAMGALARAGAAMSARILTREQLTELAALENVVAALRERVRDLVEVAA